MKQTNVTHNIRVDKNRSNRAVYEAWGGDEWPISDFGMAMVNRKRGKRR